MERKKITGIVLSGGKSSRMGTEKGLVKWRGKALIEYSLDALQKVCDQIIISSNKDCYSYLDLPVVKDEIENCGPMGGIYSCMKAYPSDIYVVVSCDVPNVSSALFSDLIANLDQNDVIIPVDEKGKKQPLAAVYRYESFPQIEKELLNGRYKMMKLLDLMHTKAFLISPDLPYYSNKLLSNANTPDDIAAL